METYYWSTDIDLNNNNDVMNYFIDHENTELEIYLEDGTYAEGEDSEGNCWEIHASGNGDFYNHKIEFKAL